ncbi:MAG: SurA N-terminal domain-containing protein [Pseudomonadota bacterium]
MLDFLRRGVKSWVAKVLLAVLILSFAVWGIEGVFSGGANRTIASVGDTPVTSQRFASAIQRQQNILSQRRGQLVSLETMRQTGLARTTLAGLVRDAAFTEELSSMEVAVSNQSIADAIRANEAFQDGQGAFSQFLFQDTVASQGFDPREFEILTGTLLGQQILYDAVANGVSTPPGVAETIAKWRGETRTIHTVTLTPDTAPDPGTPDPGQLQAFYDTDPARFTQPERRWGSYLILDVVALADTLRPTDEELRAEYDANIARFTEEPARTVEQIVFRNKADADAAVQRLAEGSATYEEIAAEQNVPLGDLSLGSVGEADLPEATSAAVFALTEPGIAGPVETPFGHAVLNVTAVSLGGATPFDQVREDIAQSMSVSRARAEAGRRVSSIEDARASGGTMDEIAKETGLTLIRFAGLASDGTVTEGDAPAIAGDARFQREAFEALDGEERDIEQTSDGSYILVMIDRIEESHVPDLEAVAADVTEAWQAEERLAALEKQATELVATASSGRDLTEVAAEVGTEVSERPAFSRVEPPQNLSQPLVDAVFGTVEGGMVIGRDRTDTGVIIASVQAISPLQGDDLAQQVAAAEQALSTQIAGDQLEFYARAIEARHGAQINEGAVDQVFELLINPYQGGYGHGGM